MRKLVILLAVVAVICGGWIGAETWLAGRVQAFLTESAEISASSVSGLRDPSRFGLDLKAPRLAGEGVEVSAPDLAVWVSPLAPTTLSATLPDQIEVMPAGALPFTLGLSGAKAGITVSPIHEMRFTRLSAATGPFALSGAPLGDALSLEGKMMPLSFDAPRAAGAAYEMELRLDNLHPESLPALASAPLPEGALSIRAEGRVWLSDAPTATGPQAEPLKLVGFRLQTAEITYGELKAHLLGRVEADAEGRASGQVMIYTKDARAFLDHLAAAGILPEKRVPLALTVLTQLSQAEAAASATPATGAGAQPGNAETTAPSYPAPEKGEIRLPLNFSGGKTMLGPLGLGPAPLLQP